MTTGDDTDLVAIGLHRGARVRFRRRSAGRWQEAVVVGRERDGSVGVRDTRGAARALPLSVIEVRTSGPRGAAVWEPLTERAARTEQLELF